MDIISATETWQLIWKMTVKKQIWNAYHCMENVRIQFKFKNTVFSCPYFPAFGLNAEISSINPLYSVRIQEDMDQKKLRIWTLLAHGKNYKKTTGSLWNYYRYEPSNPLSSNSESFKYKTSITGNTYNVDLTIIGSGGNPIANPNMVQIKLVNMKLKLLFH